MVEARERREIWLDVPGYEGVYEASNLGSVKRISTGRALRASLDAGGYRRVTLSKGGRPTNLKVSVVILTTFCGPKPFPDAHAAHNDGDSMNDALTNLRWATPRENQADINRHGNRCRGEAVFGSKLTARRVRAIRDRIGRGLRNRPIADEFGVSPSTIHLIRHGKIWTHV